jgi:hypothetical protein
MRKLIILSVSALFMAPLLADEAAARPGGGFRGGGFHGGFSGGVRGQGLARPGFAGAGIVRPGWHGSGTQWAGRWRPGWNPGWRPGGWRPGWNWAATGLGLAAGALAAAPYYGYGYPSGYYATSYDCPTVRQRVWDGYRYRIVWVNSCGY